MKELIKCFPMPLRLYMCILVALVVALQFAEPPSAVPFIQLISNTKSQLAINKKLLFKNLGEYNNGKKKN